MLTPCTELQAACCTRSPSLLAWPPARLGRVLKTRNGQQSILHSPSCPLTCPSFSCSLSKPAPRHCCWSSVAIIAEPQSSSAGVPVAPVLLRLLGPRPAYLHHQAHVVWLSFERRALPYMAAAVSVRTDATAKLARVVVAELCPLASSVRSPRSVHMPPAPPLAAGELDHLEPAIFPCSLLWKPRRTAGKNLKKWKGRSANL